MLPWDMRRLTREEVFEVYLEPEKSSEEEDASGMTTRERAFYAMQGQRLTWLQIEAAYQRWERAR